MSLNNEPIHIAVAESSLIIRSGMIVALKRMPGMKIHAVEVVSQDSLEDCIKMHTPDILIVNPSFNHHFNVGVFKEKYPDIKCLALLCSFMDQSMLSKYDDSFFVFDLIEIIASKIETLLKTEMEEDVISNEEEGSNQETLSSREKEIVVCVVKGMTNKEIADALYLSIHTVITHRRNITRKLQIHSPAGLTIYAIVSKLVDIKDVK